MSCYFIELYLDNLRDLLFAMDHPTATPPRLEIHMDHNKMVVVKNVVVKVGGALLADSLVCFLGRNNGKINRFH